jgi:two-component system, sensor histidine kinase
VSGPPDQAIGPSGMTLRERIWSTQQEALGHSALTGIGATWVASMLVAGFVYWVHPPLRSTAVGWGFACCVLAATHAAAWQWFCKQRWSLAAKERFLVGMVVPHAVMLSLQSILLASHGVREISNFLVCLLAGLACGGVPLLAPRKPVYWTMMLPPLLVQAGVFFYLSAVGVATPFHFVLGLAMLTLTVSMLVFLNTQSDFVTRGIRLGFENAALVEQLQQQTQVAEAANMAKTRFLAAASHDLRQPAHALNLFVEVLAGTQLDAHQQRILGHIRAASAASREMLGTLLDFSRIEAGVMKAQMQSVPLAPLLLNLQEEFGLQADAKNLVYRSRDTHAVAHADPALLALVLRNLVSNAIRYTELGGLLVGVRSRGNELAVQVWDTGLGIAREQHEEVFKEFHQLGNPERDRQKGLGLGLAIARGLAAAMNARITLQSAPGKGSVFSVWLERASPEAQVRVSAHQLPGAALSAHDKPQSQNTGLQPTGSAWLAPRPAAGSGASSGASGLDGVKVLVVDDEAPVRASMSELLRMWGCEVRVAEGLSEVRGHIASGFVPSALITDYRLRDDTSGGDVIAWVRAELAERIGGPLPAIIVTGDTSPDRILEATSHNALVLHKPVEAVALRQHLRAITRLWPAQTSIEKAF